MDNAFCEISVELPLKADRFIRDCFRAQISEVGPCRNLLTISAPAVTTNR